MTLSEQLLGVFTIVDLAFRSDESGYYLLIGINRDRNFQEMFPDLAGSGGVIMAGITAGEPG